MTFRKGLPMFRKGKHHFLLKNLPDAFAYFQTLTDSKENPVDYIFLEVNAAFEKMAGLQKKQVLGKKISEIDPETINFTFNWEKIFRQVATRQGSIRFEHYYEPGKRWYEITACSDAPGNFAIIFRDVTKSKHFQDNLKETTQRLEYILRATRTGIDIIDKNYSLQYVDSLWQGIYGAYRGQKCYTYFKNRQYPCENCGVPHALKTKQVTLSEQILPKENNRIIECHIVPFQNERGEWLAAGFKTDITRLKRLEEKLKFQLQFEKMVSSISNLFVDIEAERINTAIKQSLQQVGEFFKLDRSAIFQLFPAEKVMVNTHEWCAPGIKPLTDTFKRFSADKLPWLFTQTRKRGPLHIPDTGKIPPEAAAEKKGFARQGIRSLLALPFSIRTHGYTRGFLAIDAVREKKSWTEDQIHLLNIVAEVIANAFSRQQLEKKRALTEKALKESEESLSITLHSIGDAVITTDLCGKITRMNPQAEKLTGWSWAEAASQTLEKVFHIINTKTGKPAFNPVQYVLRTGKVVKLSNDTTLIARNGIRRQISDSAAPIRNSKGKIAGAVIVFSDITEQYEARETLKKSEARYRTIVENINDALFIRDFKGEILDLNEATCRLLGYKREALLGTNLALLRNPEEQKRTPQRLKQLLKDGQLLFEGTLMHKNGTPVLVEVSQKVVSHAGGGLVQSFVRDITKRKQNEQKIVDYTSKLEKLYRKLDEEINRARQVHERTLPKKLPAVRGISLAAHYQPAERLGGDFYDVVQQGKKMVIYLSDVTGHGADSAMLSVFVKHTIKGYLSFSPEKNVRPEKILRHLSNQFHQKDLPPEYFICIFLAVLDLETMELTYTAAGFQDTPLVRLGNGKRLRLVSKGLFLSPAFSDKLLNLQENCIRLTPGSTIFFNTDGLTEQGAKNTYYGTRLPGVFYKNSHLSPPLLARIVCEDFRKFNRGSLQGSDDITFLILQIDPNPKKVEHLQLASNFTELKHLRKKITGILGNHRETDLFWACLHELTANAIEHGNLLDQKKKVSVEIIITKQFIQGSVEDQGAGFNWRQQVDKPLDLEGAAERGRGIALARICSELLLYNEKGNRATFILKGLQKEENNHAD